MNKCFSEQLPLVSVIIPFYNAERYLSAAITSVISQNFDQWELLLVDDGSTDESASICEQYCQDDPRIRLITTTHAGVSHARNAGLDEARGEWVCFLDGDDQLASDALAAYLAYTEGVDVVMGEYPLRRDECGQILRGVQWFIPATEGEERLVTLYHLLVLCTVWNKLYRRSAICHPFRTDMLYGEDTLFNLDHLLHWKRIVVIPGLFYFYRDHPGSLTKKVSIDRIRLAQTIFDAYYAIFKHCKQVVYGISNEYVFEVVQYCKQYIWRGGIPESTRFLLLNTMLNNTSFDSRRLQFREGQENFRDLYGKIIQGDIEGIIHLYPDE